MPTEQEALHIMDVPGGRVRRSDRTVGPMSFVTIERAVLYQLIELAARAARTMDDVAVVDYAAIAAATCGSSPYGDDLVDYAAIVAARQDDRRTA